MECKTHDVAIEDGNDLLDHDGDLLGRQLRKPRRNQAHLFVEELGDRVLIERHVLDAEAEVRREAQRADPAEDFEDPDVGRCDPERAVRCGAAHQAELERALDVFRVDAGLLGDLSRRECRAPVFARLERLGEAFFDAGEKRVLTWREHAVLAVEQRLDRLQRKEPFVLELLDQMQALEVLLGVPGHVAAGLAPGGRSPC